MTRPATTTTTDGPISYSEAERMLGLDRRVIAWLAAHNGLEPRPVRWNARAKGLDADDLEVVRAARERVKVPDRPDRDRII